MATLFVVAGCVDMTPIVVSSEYDAPRTAPWYQSGNARGAGQAAGPCRVYFAEIRDTRPDPQSLGSIASRPVRATDTVAWLRAGFDTLSKDARLRLVDGDAAADSDLVLNVDLINAYVMSVTSETRTANVILRVRYGRQGAADEKVYRGTDEGLAWVGGSSETQGFFNSALANLLNQVDGEILTRCGNL